MLAIITPAADRNLLSPEEMRVAAGLPSGDTSQDVQLLALNSRISSVVARACMVVSGGATPLTMRSEVVSDTFRAGSGQVFKQTLPLSRLPIVSVQSVTLDNAALPSTDYEVDLANGTIIRLSGDVQIPWKYQKVVVLYTAGWVDVPDDLKLAASRLASEFYTLGKRDPNLKREKIDGIGEVEYWVSPSNDPLINDEVKALLAPYTNTRLLS
jgi:hypothetical protein